MISVFLSSTFQDMQHERDLIHKYVYPIVRSEAAKHGEVLNIVDLRWGIDTSDMMAEDAMDKILEICNDKILESLPFFIAFLGKRYGSKIDHFRDTYFSQKISVTEFEIQRCLLNSNNQAAFFIKGDIDNSDYCIEQKTLIEYIKDYYAKQIVEYRLPDSSNDFEISESEQTFIQQVIHVIKNYIAYYAALKHDNYPYDRYIHEVADTLFVRDELVSDIYDKISSHGNQRLLLYGPKGIGKRSILYCAINQLKCHVIMINHLTESCVLTAEDVIRSMIEQIRNFTDESLLIDNVSKKNNYTVDNTNEITLSGKLAQAVRNYLSDEALPLIALIEDVDLLLNESERRRLFNVIENIQSPVSWCITNVSDCCLQDIGDANKWYVRRIGFLSEKESSAMITKIYSSYGKELPQLPMHILMQKERSGYPEYINLVATLMNNFDQTDFLLLSQRTNNTDEQGDVIAQNLYNLIYGLPDDTADLYFFLVDRLVRQVPKWASDSILEWLSYCPNGLREQDLQILTEQTCTRNYSETEFQLAFRHLKQIMTMVSNREWRLWFPNNEKTNSEKQDKLCRIYISHLEKLPQKDPIKRRDLLIQYINAGGVENFYKELSEMDEFDNTLDFSQFQTIFQCHLPWLIQTMPKQLTSLHVKSVSILISNATNISFSQEMYGMMNQYMIQFMNSVNPSDYNSNSDIALGIFSAATFAEFLAHQNGDAAMRSEWRNLAQKMLNTPGMKTNNENFPGFFSDIMDATKLNITVMEELAEARSILDRDLPTELCRYVLNNAEKHLKQVENLCREWSLFHELLLGSNSVFAVLYEITGDCDYIEQQYATALKEYEKGVYFLYSTEKINYANLSAILTKMGVCYSKLHQYEKALSVYEESIHITEKALEQKDTVDDRIQRALTICRIAEIYAIRNDYETAISKLMLSKNTFQDVFDNHPSVQSMQDYAVFCYKIMEYTYFGSTAVEPGIEYGKRASLLFMKLYQSTGENMFLKNTKKCIDILEILIEKGD